jgi:TolA-binding protein
LSARKAFASTDEVCVDALETEDSACLSLSVGKNCALIMQTQDAPAEIMFKFWPWLEANKQRLIIGGSAVVLLFVVWMFVSSQQQQKLLAAGQAYTAFQLNQPANPTTKQVADGYLQIATQYAGTAAAQRAQLQAGAILFNGGSYADAQKVFENFVATESGSPLIVYARLGIAASLEAQQKLTEAAAAYGMIATSASSSAEGVQAKFSQARILELQGKSTEAAALYQEITRSPLAGSLATEAGQRLAAMPFKPAAK